jgi:hypothetical protein
MNQDKPGTTIDGGSSGGIGTVSMPHPGRTTDPLIYCRCGRPMHPDHLEKRRGVMMERYSCPVERWWNTMLHPHAWMAPREGVPS